MKITMEVKPMQGFGGGFRQEWASAEGVGFKAGMDSGGGLGNPYLTFWIEKGGKKREYHTADMRDVFRAFINQKLKEKK
jgi:hypothetical protein